MNVTSYPPPSHGERFWFLYKKKLPFIKVHSFMSKTDFTSFLTNHLVVVCGVEGNYSFRGESDGLKKGIFEARRGSRGGDLPPLPPYKITPWGEGKFFSESLKNASIYRQKCSFRHKTGKIFNTPPVPNMTLYSMGEGVNSHSEGGEISHTLHAYEVIFEDQKKISPLLENFS